MSPEQGRRSVELPVRWWGDEDVHVHGSLPLNPAATALALVDCDGGLEPSRYDHRVKLQAIAPALQAARAAGIRVLYFHNAPGGEGGPLNVHRDLHGLRHGRERLGPPGWKPVRPVYLEELRPQDDEPEFQKAHQDGFRDTAADPYLRSWGVTTLVLAGFSLKSCLYHTAWAAQEHNYRVVVLRDATCPSGSKEYADTLDPGHPEGGWMRGAVLRLIETNVGYTSTSSAFVWACTELRSVVGDKPVEPPAQLRPSDPGGR
ncbi:isochorismatase family protein [Deinococcus humi]|uniref:Nicotinamidase-related amidase n=1 Tax=Deinococcus humi TaxID=662880 RepID=A0A7W8JVA4_9DEIO|nr:nicotinamidase-related amidase [Deinococcus humi]